MTNNIDSTCDTKERKGATGPTTPEGKAISSKNSFKHGFYARFREFRTEEERDESRYITAGFIDSWRPVGVAETAMVHQLAWCHYWTLRWTRLTESLWNTDLAMMFQLQDSRAEPRDEIRAEQDALLIDDPRQRRLDRLRRAITTEHNKALKQLIHLQSERRRREKEEAELRAQDREDTQTAEGQSRKESVREPEELRSSSAAEFVPANAEWLPELDT